MALPIRNLRTLRYEQKGVLIAGVPYPLSSIALPFLLPPNPLPLSKPATQSALAFFLFGEGDNAVSLIVLYSKKFVNFLIHKFRLSLGSSGSC